MIHTAKTNSKSLLRSLCAVVTLAICMCASAADKVPQLPFSMDGSATTSAGESTFDLDSLQSSLAGTAMEPAVRLMKAATGYCASIGRSSPKDLPLCINTIIDSTIKNLGAHKVLVPAR